MKNWKEEWQKSQNLEVRICELDKRIRRYKKLQKNEASKVKVDLVVLEEKSTEVVITTARKKTEDIQ